MNFLVSTPSLTLFYKVRKVNSVFLSTKTQLIVFGLTLLVGRANPPLTQKLTERYSFVPKSQIFPLLQRCSLKFGVPRQFQCTSEQNADHTLVDVKYFQLQLPERSFYESQGSRMPVIILGSKMVNSQRYLGQNLTLWQERVISSEDKILIRLSRPQEFK